MALAPGDLVDPDPEQLVEPGGVERFVHDPHHGPGDRGPRDPEQTGDGRLVHALGAEGHQVLEVAGQPSARPRPGHLLCHHAVAAPTAEPSDLGLQQEAARAQVQVSPPADRSV
jgi:hypothetical protein